MTEPALCPYCNRMIVTDDGAFRRHLGTGDYASNSCPSTGTLADQQGS